LGRCDHSASSREMVAVEPKLSGQLSRLEVHATPLDEEAREPDVTWIVNVHPMREGLLVTGYVRRAGAEGFGQAQSIAWLHGDAPAFSLPKKKLELWLREYVTENLYDTCRYALQGQAAQMDFKFDLPMSPPESFRITFNDPSED
jgi:hypothetical protein